MDSKQTRVALAEQAVRLASNILVETLGNHRLDISPARRDLLQCAVGVLSRFIHTV